MAYHHPRSSRAKARDDAGDAHVERSARTTPWTELGMSGRPRGQAGPDRQAHDVLRLRRPLVVTISGAGVWLGIGAGLCAVFGAYGWSLVLTALTVASAATVWLLCRAEYRRQTEPSTEREAVCREAAPFGTTDERPTASPGHFAGFYGIFSRSNLRYVRGRERVVKLANRSGRAIALARLLLGSFFLVASVRAIDGQVESPAAALSIEVGYLAFAATVLAVTWSNWWVENRLRLASHLIDIGVFLALDLAAGVPVTSPFFVFFVFLVLSAAASWGWRAALWTGAAGTLIFTSETALEMFVDPRVDDDYVYAFMRGAHLVVLTIMLSWFGMAHLFRDKSRTATFRDVGAGEDPVQRALTHMAGCLGGRSAAMMWSDSEEPWIYIARWDDESGLATKRLGPAELDWLIAPKLSGRTFLFDLANERALVEERGHLSAVDRQDVIHPGLADHIALTTGIATPLISRPFDGYVFVSGVEGLSSDDLPDARRCALDLARGLERWDAARSAAEMRAGETRLRIARDLHDSVAQIMAGIGMKLRAARRGGGSRSQLEEELGGIEEELLTYQKQIQRLIEDLRQPRIGATPVDLDAKLREIACTIRRQWSINVEATGDHLASIPELVSAEMSHLLSEAASNAVRHGQADWLFLAAEVVDGRLLLSVQDNGRGFCEKGSFDHRTLRQQSFRPRSIVERVQELQGTVDLVSTGGGTLLTISVPLDSKTS